MTTKAIVDTLIAEMLGGDESVIPVLQDAIESGVEGAGKLVYKVMTEKATTWKGVTRQESRIPNAFAIIEPGKSIRLIGLSDTYDYNTKTYAKRALDKTYKVGDACLRYSWNGFDYDGTIQNISAKTVSIAKVSHKTERHDLAKFWRNNICFDAAQSKARNLAWMD